MSNQHSSNIPPSDLERVVIIGTTSAGKSTLALQLSNILDVPFVEMDALNWEPNWTEATEDVFRERMKEAVSGDRWVAAGNYGNVRDLVWPNATAIVWLDYSIVVVFWRLLWRTVKRTVTREELWNGNKERLLTQFLTKDSLFLWALKTHWRRRKSAPTALAEPEHAHLQVFHLTSPKATKRWISNVEQALV